MGYQGVKLGFEAFRFPLSRNIAQDIQPTQIGIAGTWYRRRRDGQFSILRFLLDRHRRVASLLVGAILRQVSMEGGRVGKESFPQMLQISKGHPHDFFSGHRKEFAKWTIDGMHYPTGRNEEKCFTGSIKNGPTLTLGAFHQGILAFEGAHSLLDSIQMLLNRISHAIDRLTDLV